MKHAEADMAFNFDEDDEDEDEDNGDFDGFDHADLELWSDIDEEFDAMSGDDAEYEDEDAENEM